MKSCWIFFQAEDGIRDKLVTGVQTCALPILNWRLRVNLEGVTGTLTLRAGGTVEREAMPSVFRDGAVAAR